MNECKILISGDYNVFNEGWNGMGVYACIGSYQSKKLSLPIYIGSSGNLKERIQHKHFSTLRSNIHDNIVFQNAWNKYGEKQFVWILLDECNDSKQLLELEQLYLDFCRPFIDEQRGFNINHIADKPPDTTGIPKPKTEITRRKMSEAGKKKIFTNEHKQNISRACQGEKNGFFGKQHSEVTKQKMKEKWKFRKPVSIETRRKMSDSGRGRKFSEEHKRKIGESNKGRIVSQATREKISQTRKLKKINQVLCWTKIKKVLS